MATARPASPRSRTTRFNSTLTIEIGRGAFASVYSATLHGEAVAVKAFILPDGGGALSEVEAIFRREATIQYNIRNGGDAAT